MKLSIAILTVLAALAAAAPKWHQLDGYSFEQYKADFAKVYSSAAEHEQRQIIFENKLADIKRHNADNTKTWKEGVNQFTDHTPSEFKKYLGYNKAIGMMMHKPRDSPSVNEFVAPLPSSVDWRDQGIVTPVKNQGQCGSCWSFATAEVLESQYAKATGILTTVSEQNILDCVPNPQKCGGTGGCEGGTAELAYAYFSNHTGIATEWTYPYVSYYGKDYDCRTDVTHNYDVKVKGYTKLPSNEYEPLLQAVANVGPIAISVEALHWSAYESGVFDGCNQTDPDIDHAVVLVGYGTDADLGDYYLVRNSWSPTWGDKGYIRIKRTADEQTRCGIDTQPADGSGCAGGPPTVKACGTCAILYDTCYPLV